MKNKKPIQDNLWLGTTASFDFLLEAEAKIDALVAAGTAYPDEDELPDNLSIVGSVGVLSIRGPLTNRDSPWNKYMGITSYNEIRASLVEAAQRPEIKTVLLDIDSGGGAVSGISDTGDLITLVDTQVKPVFAYTEGAMMSAAYWAGSSARKVYASEVASVGSIGVLCTHVEYSKQMKEAGVTATVMRAGKYKALANPYEPLSEDAKAQVQVSLDAAYKIFVEHVAEARNVPYDYADTNMAQGREFFGQGAMDAGLVDGIMSFDAMLSHLEQKALDNENQFGNNRADRFTGADMNKKKVALSAQEIAAIAAGGIAASAAEPTAEQQAATQAATQAAEAEAGAKAATEAQAAADAEAAQAAASVASAGTDTNLVAYLQAELKDRDAKVLQSAVEHKALTDKVAAMEATHAPLLAIACNALNNMKVALGGAALDLSASDAVSILAEHKVVSENFKKQFPVGGVASVDASQKEAEASPAMNSMTQAIINATVGVKK